MSESNEKVYVEERYFTDETYYSFRVTSRGVTVYSECCADTMTRESAIILRDAINSYLGESE